MGRGRPKEDMGAKLHRLIRSRIKHKSRGAHVPAKAVQEARRSRPKPEGEERGPMITRRSALANGFGQRGSGVGQRTRTSWNQKESILIRVRSARIPGHSNRNVIASLEV